MSKVPLIEENPGNTKRVTVVPEEFGHTVLQAADAAAGIRLARNPATILIVDDDAFNLKLAVTVLTQAGYEVQSADGGEAAVSRIENARQPDASAWMLSK
ncbi:MAG: hypothetical protein WCH35_16585 [Comamonadaceae bacterium]